MNCPTEMRNLLAALGLVFHSKSRKGTDGEGVSSFSALTTELAATIAIITGIISYLTANKKAKAEIATLQESNKHEIEKLMKQHEVDIESLKEKHQLETEKCEQEHKHKIEIMQIEHKNALESNEKQQSNAAMFSVMTDIIKEPQKLQGLLELANNPAFKK